MEKFTDTPVIQTSVNFLISSLHFVSRYYTWILKLCRVTKVKVLFLVLVYVFNFDLFEFSAAILEKGLFIPWMYNMCHKMANTVFFVRTMFFLSRLNIFIFLPILGRKCPLVNIREGIKIVLYRHNVRLFVLYRLKNSSDGGFRQTSKNKNQR